MAAIGRIVVVTVICLAFFGLCRVFEWLAGPEWMGFWYSWALWICVCRFFWPLMWPEAERR